MNYRLIKYFCVVAQELSISRASSKLYIEQSPLSRAIRKLEAQYGAELFVRGGRHLTLTWTGKVLLKEACAVLERIDLLEKRMASAVQGYGATLKIAICDEINTIRLSNILSAIHLQRPDLDIQINEMQYLDAINALKNESCGICIAQSKCKTNGLETTLLWEKPLAVLMPFDHPLKSVQSLYLKDVLKNPIILYDDWYYGHKLQLKNLITSHNASLRQIFYANSFKVMHAMVAAGSGLGLCSNDWFQNREMCQVSIRAISEKARMNTYLISTDNEVCKQVKKIIIETLAGHENRRCFSDAKCLTID